MGQCCGVRCGAVLYSELWCAVLCGEVQCCEVGCSVVWWGSHSTCENSMQVNIMLPVCTCLGCDETSSIRQ